MTLDWWCVFYAAIIVLDLGCAVAHFLKHDHMMGCVWCSWAASTSFLMVKYIKTPHL